MKISECLDLLALQTETASQPAAENTPLHRSAEAVLTMARAYESDGRTFLSAGDPVNALASAWYGSGWLHFAIAYGLLATSRPAGCPFGSPCEPLPPSARPKLEEKTLRYQRLLDTARESVACGSEPLTPAREFSERVLLIAARYSSQGAAFSRAGSCEDALTCFSYGHGWIDAAVRTGLFSVRGNRELFTL